MKQYVVTDRDIETLLARLDRAPEHGQRGGSSVCLDEKEREAYRAAHRFYNYQVQTWLNEIRE